MGGVLPPSPGTRPQVVPLDAYAPEARANHDRTVRRRPGGVVPLVALPDALAPADPIDISVPGASGSNGGE